MRARIVDRGFERAFLIAAAGAGTVLAVAPFLGMAVETVAAAAKNKILHDIASLSRAGSIRTIPPSGIDRMTPPNGWAVSSSSRMNTLREDTCLRRPVTPAVPVDVTMRTHRPSHRQASASETDSNAKASFVVTTRAIRCQDYCVSRWMSVRQRTVSLRNVPDEMFQ